MKALLYKDLIVMKKEIFMSAVILLIYIPLILLTQNKYLSGAFIGITSGLAALFPNYSFVHDRQAGWESFLYATPFKRRTIVLQKFLLLFLALPLLFIGLLTVFFLPGFDLSLLGCLSLVFATLVFGYIQIPLYFALGPNKARIIMMLTFFIVFYGMFTLLMNDRLASFLPPEHILAALLGTFAVAGFFAAYFISLAVYRNKEF